MAVDGESAPPTPSPHLPFYYYYFFILLWSLELKRESGRQPARCLSFVFRWRYVACLPPQSLALPSSLSPSSQVFLIKSVSLAWQAKIIGEGFWMPFTLNGACFFPFSRLSSALPLLLPPSSLPLPALISWQVVTYLPPSSFFSPLRFHLIFRREIWINFSCVAEGTTPCELQILANTAIYLKWQIRQSNLPESRRFFELSSFERVLRVSSPPYKISRETLIPGFQC